MAIACPPPSIAAELGSLLAHFGGLAPLAVQCEMVRRGLSPRAEAKSLNFRDLNVPVSGLHLMAHERPGASL
jgi:hypothetical protein